MPCRLKHGPRDVTTSDHTRTQSYYEMNIFSVIAFFLLNRVVTLSIYFLLYFNIVAAVIIAVIVDPLESLVFR